MDDTRIIELFFERSEEALAALADKYGSMCRRLSKGILGSDRDAEECENDTYLALWNSIPPERPRSLAAYVCRVVRNKAIAKYHANSAQKRNSHYDVALDELEGVFASADDTVSACEAIETSREIDEFLRSLETDDRAMFIRRYYCAESVSELAERFGLTPHAVSVRLSRIRARLKKHLTERGITI